jgi:hypothetical protein
MFGKCDVVGLYRTVSIDSDSPRDRREGLNSSAGAIGRVMIFRSAAEAASLASGRAQPDRPARPAAAVCQARRQLKDQVVPAQRESGQAGG